jgi:pyrroloquinoline quinone biosynthesis protein D
MTIVPIDLADRYEIRPPFLFRWEQSQQAHVLLYPEGIIKLNKTGGDILNYCDGQTVVADVIEKLGALYEVADANVISNGVLRFLEVSRGKGWIRIKT